MPKGKLYEKPSGEGLKNVPVEVFFVLKGKWIIPDDIKVAKGKTNNDGVFDFNVTLDKKTFEKYGLRVRIPEQKKHINPSERFGLIDRDFNSYNENALKNMRFEFYKKASLTIKLNRVQTDDFDGFSLFYRYDNQTYRGLSPENASDEKLQIETAADVYTKVMWFKSSGKTFTEGADSLICKQDSNNIININY